MERRHVENQHYIPASHIGRFSNEKNDKTRNNRVWIKRNGVCESFYTKCGKVGYKKEMYTLINNDDVDQVDRAWEHVEKTLGSAVKKLEEQRTPFFELSAWATILVPFVAQLFVRGEDYTDIYNDRPAKDEAWYKDSVNETRLVDYQIICGLLLFADWKLLRNDTSSQLILNDRGYCLFGEGNVIKGFLVPLSSRIIIMISKRQERYADLFHEGEVDKPKAVIMPIEELTFDQVIGINKAMGHFARNEIYGATRNIVEEAWPKKKELTKSSYSHHLLVDDIYNFMPVRNLNTYYNFLQSINIPVVDIIKALGGTLKYNMGKLGGNEAKE